LASQHQTFEEVEVSLEEGLTNLGTYYKRNRLTPNPSKTQIGAIHLRNHEAHRELKVHWEGHPLIIIIIINQPICYSAISKTSLL